MKGEAGVGQRIFFNSNFVVFVVVVVIINTGVPVAKNSPIYIFKVIYIFWLFVFL